MRLGWAGLGKVHQHQGKVAAEPEGFEQLTKGIRMHLRDLERRAFLSTSALGEGVFDAGMRLAIELSKVTCTSTRTTWAIVRRFLRVFEAAYRFRRSLGLDVSESMIDMTPI